MSSIALVLLIFLTVLHRAGGFNSNAVTSVLSLIGHILLSSMSLRMQSSAHTWLSWWKRVRFCEVCEFMSYFIHFPCRCLGHLCFILKTLCMIIKVFFTMLAVQKSCGSNIITLILIKANPQKWMWSWDWNELLVMRFFPALYLENRWERTERWKSYQRQNSV